MDNGLRLADGTLTLLGAMLISCVPAFGQIDEDYRDNERAALAASSATEYRSSLVFCREVLGVIPNHPRMHCLAARLSEQLGDRAAALVHLKAAATLGYTSSIRWFDIHPMNDPVFGALRELDVFEDVLALMNRSDTPVHGSRVAFTLADRAFRTEGITGMSMSRTSRTGAGPST